MNGRLENLRGKTFAEWTVLNQFWRRRAPNGNTYYEWLCECSCGVKAIVRADNLRSGTSRRCRSCGFAAMAESKRKAATP